MIAVSPTPAQYANQWERDSQPKRALIRRDGTLLTIALNIVVTTFQRLLNCWSDG